MLISKRAAFVVPFSSRVHGRASEFASAAAAAPVVYFKYKQIPKNNYKMRTKWNNMEGANASNYVNSNIGPAVDPEENPFHTLQELRRLMFEEYVETRQLDTVKEWAAKIREEKLSETPLLDLINKLSNKRMTELIPPVYYAFLSSPESKGFVGRPELILPAICHAFQADQSLSHLHSVCKTIGRLSKQYESHEQTEQIRFYIRYCFYKFMNQHVRDGSPVSHEMIMALTDAVRSSVVYKTPLVEAINFVSIFYDKEFTLQLYNSFIRGHGGERNQLEKERMHIFFPWILSKLHHDNTLDERFKALSLLTTIYLNHPQEVPTLLVSRLTEQLGRLLMELMWQTGTENIDRTMPRPFRKNINKKI